MDWLMGKARGVGRGLVNANSPIASSTIPDTNCQANSPASASASPRSVCSNNEGDLGNPLVSPRDTSVINGSEVMTNNYRVSSATTSLVNTSSNILKCDLSLKSSSTNFSTKEPIYMLQRYISQQLPLSNSSEYANFNELVEPFPSMDQNEWLAAHTIALFDNMSTIFDAIQELCLCTQLLPNCHNGSNVLAFTQSLLPENYYTTTMNEDKNKKHKSIGVLNVAPEGRASQELNSALSSCYDLIHSPRIFPVRQGDPFPSDLSTYVALICKNILLCLTHIYLAHFHHLEQLELIAHMNTLAKHFFAFTKRFSILDEKHFEPLRGFHRALLECIPLDTST